MLFARDAPYRQRQAKSEWIEIDILYSSNTVNLLSKTYL